MSKKVMELSKISQLEALLLSAGKNKSFPVPCDFLRNRRRTVGLPNSGSVGHPVSFI